MGGGSNDLSHSEKPGVGLVVVYICIWNTIVIYTIECMASVSIYVQ